jgi:serine/threonine-protein kinase
VEDRSGTVVDGRYTLVRRLGGGGAGAVYRATPSDGGPAVAVKLLDPALARRPEMKERFEREARALNGLEHPHLIRFLDFGVHEGSPYLVMELLEGTPLDRLLASRPLPPSHAFELGLGIVAGLAHAHAHGVLHRDLKPANVFVAVLTGGVLHPKVLDFGLARFTDVERWGAHATLTEEGTVIGTPTYMAPEQGFGARTDPRSDVYSAGILLYELLAARPPFVSDSRSSVIRAHSLEPPPPIHEVRPGLTLQPALAALLDTALAKKPADRFPDARAMLRALQSVPEPAARYA